MKSTFLAGNAQRGRAVVGGVILLVAVGAGSWWWTHRPANPAVPGSGVAVPSEGGATSRRAGGGNRTQPVTVTTVEQRDIKVIVNAIGNMTALNTAIVRAKVDGELKAIRFKEGQTVRAGQLLAELDAHTYEVQLAQMQGQFVRDQAQLRNAQLDLERYKGLLAKDSIARQQVDTQDALVHQLQGTVQADQAQVDNARLQLSYTRIIAPISGRLGLKQVDLGSLVRSSDANGLVTITQSQPISLVFAVPETHLAAITHRLKGKDPLLVEVWDREQRNQLGQGRVTTVDNAIDLTTDTIRLKAEFPNADASLFPNQFVNVRLQLSTLGAVTAVPSSAVQRGAQGTYVYVVKDGVVGLRRVRLGAADGDWVSVQGEVAPGDKVVTDGADRLREGSKVDVIVPQVGPDSAGRKSRRTEGAASTATASAPPEAPHDTRGADGHSSSPPAASASGGDLPPWLDRLPPEVQEQFKKMSPEERQAFIEKRREMRRQREAAGG